MLRQIDYIYSQPEGSYTKEGKIIPFINYQRSAPERCLDMLLAKYYGESYQSEVLMDLPEKRSVPELRCDLRKATILLILMGDLCQKEIRIECRPQMQENMERIVGRGRVRSQPPRI